MYSNKLFFLKSLQNISLSVLYIQQNLLNQSIISNNISNSIFMFPLQTYINKSHTQSISMRPLPSSKRTFNYIPSNHQILTKKRIATQMNLQTSGDIHNWPCLICMQTLPVFPFADCCHRLVCVQCLESCLLQKLKKKQLLNCLMQKCNGKMLTTKGSSFSQFGQKTKQRYNEVIKIISYEKQISENNVIRNCRVIDCNGYLNLKTGKCILCDTWHCLTCLRLHPKNQPCDDIRISFFANSLNFKRCKVCKNGIQKIEGCSKIRCNNCNHLFCYQCQQPWTPYHHMCSGVNILMLPYYYLLEGCLRNPQNNRLA